MKKKKKWLPDMPTCGEHKAFFALLRHVDKMLEDRKKKS